MRNLIHFYYQNKSKVWAVILSIALVIIVIQIINNIYMQDADTNDTDIYNNNNNNNNLIGNSTNTIVNSNNSLVDGNKISTGKLKNAQETINQFIQNCNNGNVEQAYELLTSECKEQLYPTIQLFTDNYYKELFKSQKQCYIENWSGYTYKVTITEDMLSTGNVSSKLYVEYMTLVRNGEDYKLNINNYIGRTNINKTTKHKDIEATVLSKDIYIDYEIYNLKINNKSDENILLDDLKNEGTIYLKDSNDIKYDALNYKLNSNDMVINKGINKNIEVTFSNGYITNRKYKNLVFSELILNYGKIDSSEKYTFFINL